MGEGIRTDAAKPVDFAKAIARRPGAAQRLVAFSTDAKRMEFVCAAGPACEEAQHATTADPEQVGSCRSRAQPYAHAERFTRAGRALEPLRNASWSDDC